LSRIFNEVAYLKRHRRVAFVCDFFRDFWKSWVVKVYGWTFSTLSLITLLLPNISSDLKPKIAACLFGSGLLISFITFAFLPKRYITGADPNLEDLARIRLAHNGEEIAKKANRCARAHFGKTMGFPYEMYKLWRAKNPLIFTAFLAQDGSLIGFCDVFPLKSEAGERMIVGDMSEDELSIDDICDVEESEQSKYIYVASVVCCVHSSLSQSAVLAASCKYITSTYAPQRGRNFFAVGGTKDGERVLKRLGFEKVFSQEVGYRNKSLYLLRSSQIGLAKKLSGDPSSIMRIRLEGLLVGNHKRNLVST
jgi:hypothetical protein